jgi:serine/threonine protein kinase
VYYDIPLKIKSFDDFHRIHKQRHEPQNPERLSCFIHLLKGLLNVDPKHRWNVKQALLHPFITGEVFTGKPTFNKGNFNPTNAEISMMIFPSLETTYRSEREIVYNSMIMENNFNNLNSCNDSVDCSNYRPNVGRIPMRKLKDFPKIIPLKLEYMVNSNKKGKFNKFDDQHNNTFMMTSFDKLNSSTYEDTMVQGYRHRKLKKEGSSKVMH